MPKHTEGKLHSTPTRRTGLQAEVKAEPLFSEPSETRTTGMIGDLNVRGATYSRLRDAGTAFRNAGTAFRDALTTFQDAVSAFRDALTTYQDAVNALRD